MPIVSRLTGVGTFYAFDFDEQTQSNVNLSGLGTAFAYEFDENVGVANTLIGSTRMRYLPSVGIGTTVVVFDSINEIDPLGELPTENLQLYVDPGISTSVTETPGVGQSDFTTAGSFTFIVPNGVTSISAVVIGGGGGGAGATAQVRGETNGGGGGGGLAYASSISVTPGDTLTVTVGSGGNAGTSGNNGGAGGPSTLIRSGVTLLSGGGGGGGIFRDNGNATGGTSTGTVRTGGGSGGNGGTSISVSGATGGGGAGGYSGNGGAGGTYDAAGSTGSGGGGGGGGGFSGTTSNLSGGGGGTGILGSGSNGTAGTTNGGGGGGGSSGTSGGGNTTGTGGNYGGGGGGRCDNINGGAGAAGSVGAVRIIWGSGRSYPSTNVTNQTSSEYSFTLTDLSGNGRTSSSVNGPIYSSTTNSGIINYDGVNDYMIVTGYKGVTGTGARTSILFFKTSSPNISPRLFGWGAATTGNKWNVSLDATTYRVRAEIGTGSVTCNSGTPNVTDGNWHMVASSAPASGTANDIKIYIDGNLITDTTITSGATAINTSSGSDVSFAASIVDAAPGYLPGSTSMFLIYDRQLTDLEIKIIYRTILNRFYI